MPRRVGTPLNRRRLPPKLANRAPQKLAERRHRSSLIRPHSKVVAPLLALCAERSGPARIANHVRTCSLRCARPASFKFVRGHFTPTTKSSLSLVVARWGENGPARIMNHAQTVTSLRSVLRLVSFKFVGRSSPASGDSSLPLLVADAGESGPARI